MRTDIQYNFGDQYFEITGRSQQSCDDTYVQSLGACLCDIFKLFLFNQVQGYRRALDIPVGK